MEFEWDEAKSEANLAKHGIGFAEARALWDDPDMLRASSNHGGERRWVVLAKYGGRCWAAVHAMRGPRVRIISVRLATPKEASAYDKANR